MTQNEFLEKFLPDFKKKKQEWRANGQLQDAEKYDFERFYFNEALQNYTNEICEEQRVNCCKAFEKSREEWNDFDNGDMYASHYFIGNAKQPKINKYEKS